MRSLATEVMLQSAFYFRNLADADAFLPTTK